MRLISKGDARDRREVIIADDLTGACDTAVAFLGGGKAAEVILHFQEAAGRPEAATSAEVIAVQTESRDLGRQAALDRLRAAYDFANGFHPRLLFKKIDSAFRGNTCLEIRESLDLLPAKFAILAPAFPGQGRRVREGQLFIDGIAGPSAIDLIAALGEQGLGSGMLEVIAAPGGRNLAENLVSKKNSGGRLALCDSWTDADLDLVAQAGLDSGLDILWIGSAGLAHALSKFSARPVQSKPKQPAQSRRAVVFVIGSCHPVTLKQMDRLRSTGSVTEIQPGDTASGRMHAAIGGQGVVLVHLVREQWGLDRIRNLFEACVSDIGVLVLSGGDMASLVCDALSAQAIVLENELLPGIPRGRIRGGIADGCALVTKSGGFGTEDALVRIADRCSETRHNLG